MFGTQCLSLEWQAMKVERQTKVRFLLGPMKEFGVYPEASGNDHISILEMSLRLNVE